MADITTLESVAELLPPQQRERFFQMAARFNSVPDDDEFLHILEAIGFVTLILREVPSEIAKVLEGVKPVQESQQGLSKLLKEAVAESIPSYDDLKRIAERFENHDLTLSEALRSQPQEMPKTHCSHSICLAFLILGMIIGFAASAFIVPNWP